jgi:L-2-hydroxyglutarate oxidase LhgO
MDRVDVVIVGAGVVGLAIAAEIARKDRDLFILEKEKTYGQGSSSRNSEVIHAGINYPPSSLKAKLCVRGNELLYEICKENGIAHNRIGKIIVATNENEVKEITRLMRQGIDSGARDLEMIDGGQVKKLEPYVEAIAAVYSPNTGILDAHGLMDHFYREARKNSSIDPLILDTEVKGLKRKGDGYVVEMSSGGEPFSIESRVVINAAGLYADRVALMAGMDIEKERYRIHWCKGDYFSLSGKPLAKMLVYPEPPKDGSGLGIHATPDLTGRIKFGPNTYYVKEIDYRVESSLDEFWNDIVKYMPAVRKENLHPDMAGIRSKLQGPSEPFRDYVIRHEEDKGFPGLVNLIGIESPGLTASPAIAEMVKGIVEEIL